MKRTICLFTVFSLLIVLAGVIGYNEGKGSVEGNSPETEGFSTIVQMNGKDLAVGTPTIGSLGFSGNAMVAVAIKNLGHEAIDLAELEVVLCDSNGLELVYFDQPIRTNVMMKELSPGEVRTLCWWVPLDIDSYDVETIVEQGISCKVEVKRLE